MLCKYLIALTMTTYTQPNTSKHNQMHLEVLLGLLIPERRHRRGSHYSDNNNYLHFERSFAIFKSCIRERLENSNISFIQVFFGLPLLHFHSIYP